MIAALLDRFSLDRLTAARGPIVLALSGGGDSVALLHALREKLGAGRLHAVVIDHALREGSAADARRALGFAETLGVAGEARTLAWADGQKRSQETARRARYVALCAAARGVGADTIAVAHTADDQAETVLMRASAGSSWRGLAGIAAWAPAPVWPDGCGLSLARPLLGARRDDLRAFLTSRGASWIEDPTNANPAFTRVRVRQRLAELTAGGLDPLRLTGMAAKLRVLVDAVDAEAAALIDNAALFEGEHIALAPSAWRGGAEARVRALSVLIAAAAGAEREPDADSVARLEARCADEDFRGAALGGARLERKGAAVRIGRDPGALTGRADGAAGVATLALPVRIETVWDGRLALTASETGWRIRAGAGGAELERGDTRVQLAEAQRLGAVSCRWLQAAHVAHLLAGKFTVSPSGSGQKPMQMFTAP